MPPLRCILTAVTLVILGSTLTGCGSSSPTAPSTVVTNPLLAALPANLEISLTTNLPSPILPSANLTLIFTGDIAVQGSSVSGVFRFTSGTTTPCVPPSQDIPFTGSLNTSNQLILTTSSFAGTTGTITLQLPATPAGTTATYQATGTAQLTGGACAATITQTSGIFVPSVTGTFTGTLTPSTLITGNPATGSGGTATVVLSQASANADGQFPLTGTLNFASPNCTLATPVTGIVSGLTVQFVSGTSFPTTPGAVAAVSFFGGAFSPGLASSQMDVTVAVPGCSDVGFYTGSLTRQ